MFSVIDLTYLTSSIPISKSGYEYCGCNQISTISFIIINIKTTCINRFIYECQFIS